MIAISMADFTALLRRTCEPGWLEPLLADPDSKLVLEALMTVFVREAQTADLASLASAISTAPGGRPGVAIITISRTTAGTHGTIPAGYLFVDGRGVVLEAAGPTTIADADLTKPILVQTVRHTESVNTEDDVTTMAIHPAPPASQTVLDSGAVNPLIAPVGTAGIVATTFTTVASATQILQGVSDYLSLHGKERGQLRQPNEPENVYRLRVRNIPDAVSPKGVSEGVQAAVSRLFQTSATIFEPFADGATPALKAKYGLSEYGGIYCDPNTAPTNPAHTDFFDDGGVPYTLLGVREANAYFRIVVPTPRDPDGNLLIMVTNASLGGIQVTILDATVVSSFLAIWEEANRKRAGGVQFDIFTAEPRKVLGVGHSNVNSATVVFTLTPPPLIGWGLRDGWVDHDSSLSFPTPVNTATMKHQVTFTFSDATTFTTALSGQIDSQRLQPTAPAMSGFPWAKLITKIEGKVVSDGATQVNMVGTFYVTESAA